MRQLLNVSLDFLFQDHVLGRLNIKEDESMNCSATQITLSDVSLLVDFTEDVGQFMSGINTRMMFVLERYASL